MLVTIDAPRVLHLFILIGITYLVGTYLINQYEWNHLTAYSLSCTVTVQISNAIRAIMFPEENDTNDNNDDMENTKRVKQPGSNPKKKKKNC
mmetsp:Transcript_6497/g.9947  ORF Transcript_6497/g.9947 Transcript_6497/m.9947 type:complete len:92 (+) Transcript_6497:140-415(+)